MTKITRFIRSLSALAVLASFAFSGAAFGQGFLFEPNAAHPRQLPRYIHPHIMPPVARPSVQATPYRIESLQVDARIAGSVAQTDVVQTFKNEGSTMIEAAFIFPLPYDGAIDSLTLLVDGKELTGKLLDAKEARAQYEEIVRKMRDPALLEWVGSGMYRTSVFPIPAGETRSVSIRYTQLLRSQDGLTEFTLPLGAAKYTVAPVGKVEINATITGDAEIKNVYSPSYDLKVDRPDKKIAKASVTLENTVPSRDFRLFFDQNADELSAKIQSYRPNQDDAGYFLLLASPKIVAENEQETLPKTVVFTLDVSGSMMGKKIAQARDSLSFVLSRLRDGDKFNIVLFNQSVVSYKEELQTVNDATRADALAYVGSTHASGSTNISDALARSFEFLGQDESGNPKYLFFLSDGAANVGETNEMKLAALAREKNTKQARFFSFGVGYDVHSRLLDRFVRDGRGQGEYVKPEEDIESRVAALYSKISSPVFSEVSFEFKLKNDPEKKYFATQIYPSGKIDVYSGEQLAITGRYSAPGPVEVVAKGKVGDKDVEFRYEGEFAEKSGDASYSFIERLWASRRVAEIIDEMDLNGENEELMNELLELSKRCGILTPYTSFIADDAVALNSESNAGTVRSQFRALASDANTSNAMGFSQRRLKQGMRNMNSLAASESMNASAVAAADSAMAAPDFAAAPQGGAMGGARAAARVMSRNSAPAVLGAAPPVAARAPSDSAERVRNIADKTFYLKEGRWIDSSITEDMEKNQTPVRVKQFSDEYFGEVNRNGASFSQYLVFTEPLLLNFNGKLYAIEAED